MSEISDMIQRLCPDGVEYRKLGEFISIYTGSQFNKRDMVDVGAYPVLNGGIDFSGYTHDYNEDADTIAISQGGASAGYVNWVDRPFWAGAHCYVVKPDENLLNKRYLYHFLKNEEQTIMASKQGAGIPGLNRSKIQGLEIPVPPLEVQRKIVEYLDNFSELTAELTARQKQYEYYRDNLLNFNRGGQVASDVKWMKMSEVFEIRNGYTPSKANQEFWDNGTIPWFRMEDIRQNGRILSDSILHITSGGVKGKGLFKADSFILATTATIGEHALIIADSLANQQFTNLQICKSLEKELTTKFVFYYLFVVDEWCKANTNVSGFASVDMAKFKNLLFPIPPLAEQERIVSILDRFEALTTDLTSGLPAEIKARQQQYEYYRDQLLTFKRAN